MASDGTVISYIELPAAGLAETKAFYTAVFGWTWVDYGPTYAAFEGAGIEGGLNAEATPGASHDPGAQNAIGPLVLFGTDDLGAVEAKVIEAGGEIISGQYDYPGGRRFHFRDPSGNVLAVYQPHA